MADVQEKLRVARAHLNVLMRRHREIGAGFLPPSATLDAQINQAVDEVECLEYEAAMLAYPLLWWAQVHEYQTLPVVAD